MSVDVLLTSLTDICWYALFYVADESSMEVYFGFEETYFLTSLYLLLTSVLVLVQASLVPVSFVLCVNTRPPVLPF